MSGTLSGELTLSFLLATKILFATETAKNQTDEARYVVRTLYVVDDAMRDVLHASRGVHGSANIKGNARCHALHLVIDCLVLSAARSSSHVAISVLASAGKPVQWNTARFVRISKTREWICWNSRHMAKSMSTPLRSWS